VARVNVPVSRVSRLQVFSAVAADVVAGDTVNGMRMANNGATLLWVSSSSGSAQTVETIPVETVDFSPAAPISLVVPANTVSALIGPFPVDIYGNVLEFDVSSALLGFLAFSLI